MKSDELALVSALVGAVIGQSVSKRNPSLGAIVGGALGLAAGLAVAHVAENARREFHEPLLRDRDREYSRLN